MRPRTRPGALQSYPDEVGECRINPRFPSIRAVVLGMFDQLPLALASLGALCGFLVPQLHLALGDPADAR